MDTRTDMQSKDDRGIAYVRRMDGLGVDEERAQNRMSGRGVDPDAVAAAMRAARNSN